MIMESMEPAKPGKIERAVFAAGNAAFVLAAAYPMMGIIAIIVARDNTLRLFTPLRSFLYFTCALVNTISALTTKTPGAKLQRAVMAVIPGSMLVSHMFSNSMLSFLSGVSMAVFAGWNWRAIYDKEAAVEKERAIGEKLKQIGRFFSGKTKSE